MFTRAGFNPHHQVLCFARVRMGRFFGWAQLMEWRPSRDLGWYMPGRVLAWHFEYLFERMDTSVIPLQRAQSRLPHG